jgi:hypothetical protein
MASGTSSHDPGDYIAALDRLDRDAIALASTFPDPDDAIAAARASQHWFMRLLRSESERTEAILDIARRTGGLSRSLGEALSLSAALLVVTRDAHSPSPGAEERRAFEERCPAVIRGIDARFRYGFALSWEAVLQRLTSNCQELAKGLRPRMVQDKPVFDDQLFADLDKYDADKSPRVHVTADEAARFDRFCEGIEKTLEQVLAEITPLAQIQDDLSQVIRPAEAGLEGWRKVIALERAHSVDADTVSVIRSAAKNIEEMATRVRDSSAALETLCTRWLEGAAVQAATFPLSAEKTEPGSTTHA